MSHNTSHAMAIILLSLGGAILVKAILRRLEPLILRLAAHAFPKHIEPTQEDDQSIPLRLRIDELGTRIGTLFGHPIFEGFQATVQVGAQPPTSTTFSFAGAADPALGQNTLIGLHVGQGVCQVQFINACAIYQSELIAYAPQNPHGSR